MSKSVFNPDVQDQELSSKIVVGLERISEVFKILLWEKAKQIGLSPIQIQILQFIAYHKSQLCNVSDLAKEFNVTKPTVSDAIKALAKKELIVKDYSSPDSRSYTIHLSTLGEKIVAETNDLANPLKKEVAKINTSDLESVFKTLSELIYKLNQNGILTVQRTCYGCKFYSNENNKQYCKLLEKELVVNTIKLDCPEFEKAG